MIRATYALHLTCDRCGRGAAFPLNVPSAKNDVIGAKALAANQARQEGWDVNLNGPAVCPFCLGTRVLPTPTCGKIIDGVLCKLAPNHDGDHSDGVWKRPNHEGGGPRK